jgi:hypothetical protein
MHIPHEDNITLLTNMALSYCDINIYSQVTGLISLFLALLWRGAQVIGGRPPLMLVGMLV